MAKSRQQKREEAEERALNGKRSGMNGLREQVKGGALTAAEALARLSDVSSDASIIKWLRNRVNRKPIPPPGKFHTTPKGKKGYNRKEKYVQQSDDGKEN